ncbi:FecR family protein [Pseudoflavitalea sp. G-6-1-2]|uniref:FecR family protein n=1 Tax=Pseudoflavitalea sp. G-6-1-2 TaxID=2728841 RepID=UPI00146F857F|nr:FecR family protein [Pseudoflavitalea sp. G-6-1-2]NML22327.1 FecR family protein [Pseudoflavitalea sp. G-6-1-2]
MEVTIELIRKFLENKCTREEAELVSAYLTEHPDAMDQLLPVAEWEQTPAAPQVEETVAEQWYATIRNEMPGVVKPLFSRGWMRVAAAVVLLAGAFSLYRLLLPATQQQRAAMPAEAIAAKQKEQHISNNSSQIITHILEDQSRVDLSPGSEIVFMQPLDSNKRDIHLEGEAVFHVAKDKDRPFTVYTHKFSTTALGTVFRIKAINHQNLSSVKLISGKVVVKDLGKKSVPVFLHPGEECRFSNKDNRLLLSNEFEEEVVRVPKISMKPATRPAENNEISFSNSALEEVLLKLGDLYQVTIDASQVSLTGRTFTGSFAKDQPIEDVLSTIAALNNFKVLHQGSVYTLGNP